MFKLSFFQQVCPPSHCLPPPPPLPPLLLPSPRPPPSPHPGLIPPTSHAAHQEPPAGPPAPGGPPPRRLRPPKPCAAPQHRPLRLGGPKPRSPATPTHASTGEPARTTVTTSAASAWLDEEGQCVRNVSRVFTFIIRLKAEVSGSAATLNS